MRTISHLLHPPLLDEAGFSYAAQWYVEGFAKRSGVKVTLQLPSERGRMDKDVEVALFRALQEGLTNIHKHSGASEVQVRLARNGEQLELKIEDNGRGMAKSRLRKVIIGTDCGVGIAGMRERVRELGGSLHIYSGGTGTTVAVSIPHTRAYPPAQVAAR